MEKKKLIAISALLMGSVVAKAQQATVAGSGDVKNASGSVSYSVGQVAYGNSSGSGGSVNQGVQQPYEFFTLGTNDFPNINLEMTVYPNPTNAILNLSIKDFKSKTMYYQLYDVTGRQVKEAKILDALTPIDFQSAASANYVLSVFDQGKMLKSFKIAKNN